MGTLARGSAPSRMSSSRQRGRLRHTHAYASVHPSALGSRTCASPGGASAYLAMRSAISESGPCAFFALRIARKISCHSSDGAPRPGTCSPNDGSLPSGLPMSCERGSSEGAADAATRRQRSHA